jgi:hypothetical protein
VVTHTYIPRRRQPVEEYLHGQGRYRSSGLVPLRQMSRAGIWLDLLGALLIWLYLRIVCPLFGIV